MTFGTLGPALQRRGYTVTPTRGKAPFLQGWQTRGALDASMFTHHAGSNTGLVLGVAPWFFAALDIDSTDEDWAAWCEAAAARRFGFAPVRVGRWPKRLVLVRLDAAQRKVAGPWLECLVGDRHRLEVLCQGQQCVVYGVHPDTGGAYTWTDVLGGLLEWAPGDVPVVEWSEVEAWLAECLEEAERRRFQRLGATAGPSDALPKSTSETEERLGRAPGGAGTRDPLQNYAAPCGLSIEEARQLVAGSGYDPADYDEWLRVGMALHHEWWAAKGDESEWFGLWDEWSSQAGNYAGADDLGNRWEGFTRSLAAGQRGVTMRTLIQAARAHAGVAVGPGSDAAATSATDGKGKRLRAALEDFQAYLPDHKYLYTPTGALWPASAVDATVKWPTNGKSGDERKAMKPSVWLDHWRPVMQMTWAPGEGQIITGRLIAEGGWSVHEGARVVNTYKPPALWAGDSRAAMTWRDHLRMLYPEPGEADHIERWFAHRVQRPHEKLNHALVLGGGQGIGKDTLCEPVKAGVGPWNWAEISPSIMCGAFTPWRQSVVVRVNEIHDLGETSRFAFYEATKTLAASPPDTLPVNVKHRAEFVVPNVLGLLMTTNHKLDGIYLPPDDRRHFVAWSRVERAAFDENFFARFWAWLEAGGTGAVVALLQGLALSGEGAGGWSAKAPPPHTEAWHQIVSTSTAPESGELEDALDAIGRPMVVTLETLREAVAMSDYSNLAHELGDAKRRRQWVHRMGEAGYEPVRNNAAKDGLWKIAGKRQAAYGRVDATMGDKLAALNGLLAKNSV